MKNMKNVFRGMCFVMVPLTYTFPTVSFHCLLHTFSSVRIFNFWFLFNTFPTVNTCFSTSSLSNNQFSLFTSYDPCSKHLLYTPYRSHNKHLFFLYCIVTEQVQRTSVNFPKYSNHNWVDELIHDLSWQGHLYFDQHYVKDYTLSYCIAFCLFLFVFVCLCFLFCFSILLLFWVCLFLAITWQHDYFIHGKLGHKRYVSTQLLVFRGKCSEHQNFFFLQAIFLYWMTSNVLSLVQVLVMKIPGCETIFRGTRTDGSSTGRS